MKCVFRASSVEQADIVVAWLADQGVSAFVNDRLMAGTYATFAVAPRGIKVCVADGEDASKAENLLREHGHSIEKRRGTTPDKVIAVQCPECGRQVEFPGEFYGTVQSCPKCRSNIDVGESPRFC